MTTALLIKINLLKESFKSLMGKFWEILSIIYYRHLPEKIRNTVSKKGESLYLWMNRAFSLISQIHMDVYRIEGTCREGESSLICLYIGEEETLNYFSSLAYKGTPEIEKVGKIFIWGIFQKIKLIGSSVDLVLIMINKFFTRFLIKQGYFIIPEWVSQKLDISKPLEETRRNLSGNSKEYIRKIKARIRKLGLSYEISYSMEMLEYFYRNIYVPFTLERHGKLAELLPLSHMERAFRRGGLLMVKEDDVCIGGVLFIIARGETFHIFRWGIASGDEEYLKKDVGGVLYYFSIMWAKQQGYKKVDFGGSRAFLNDGTYRYKKKWGAEVSDNKWLTSTFGLKLLNLNDGVRDFLYGNPFIFINDRILRVLIFVQQNHPVAQEQLERFFQIYYAPGLEDFTIISSASFAKDAWNIVTEMPEHKARLVDFRKSDVVNFFNSIIGGT